MSSSRAIKTTRDQRLALKAENKKRPIKLTSIPRAMWPNDKDESRFDVLISQKYLVQLFNEKNAVTRISVNRTELKASGGWEDNLTWDELMSIKAELGYEHDYAVEIYPKKENIVNVANMRHLWVLPEELKSFGWFRSVK